MGLDMMLNRVHYFSPYQDKPLAVEVEGKILENVTEIKQRMAYWRKANAVHAWFVRNVQEGNDDCGYHEVSDEQLGELLSLCKRIKKNPSLAPELLPTQGGFFFGDTSYGNWYMQDIELTIEQIEKALKSAKELRGGWFEYTSSW